MSAASIIVLFAACSPQEERSLEGTPPPEDSVAVYFNHESAPPGALMPVKRPVADAAAGTAEGSREGSSEARRRARLEAAIRGLVAGPSEEERDDGFFSFFSDAGVRLLDARLSEAGDTAWLDFTSFEGRLPDEPEVRSFLPPGVMAELTWTVFHSSPELEAVRFAFDGSEAEFRDWLGSPLEVFTRRNWEQV